MDRRRLRADLRARPDPGRADGAISAAGGSCSSSGSGRFHVVSRCCARWPRARACWSRRLLQGAFAAIMVPQALRHHPRHLPRRRAAGKVFGCFGPVIGVGAVLGPVIGGALISTRRVGVRLAGRVPDQRAARADRRRRRAVGCMPESRSPDAPTLDVVGAVARRVGSGLLIYPLIQGQEAGWPAWTFAMLAAGVVVFVAFGFSSVPGAARRSRRSSRRACSAKRAFTAGSASPCSSPA